MAKTSSNEVRELRDIRRFINDSTRTYKRTLFLPIDVWEANDRSLH